MLPQPAITLASDRTSWRGSDSSCLTRRRNGFQTRLYTAAWVGYRITEVLPIQNLVKQKLLELEDPLARLEILEICLDQHKLLG
ncbi:MAG: hypothetical protein FWF20_00345 [Betaproteobacteria bacterium]|nr:hypothetical protein [Betaproteobacteria bacterium]MCL2885230.1 hypothetical protein [Betaproteobacteria bacterium]